MKTKFILPVLLLFGLFTFCFAVESVTLLLTASPNVWGAGNLLLYNPKTNQSDTLFRGQAFGACFSPDARKVAFSITNEFAIHIIDVFTKKLETIVIPVKGRNLSWATDGCIYWGHSSSTIVFRYNVQSKVLDTAHTLVAHFGFPGDNVGGIQHGNVCSNGTRAAYMVSKSPSGTNGTIAFVMGDTASETYLHASGNACQTSMSPNGNWVAHSNSSHGFGYVRQYNDNNIIYRGTPLPMNDKGLRGTIWMFSFSYNSDNYLTFHTWDADTGNYLWQLDIDRVRQIGPRNNCVWNHDVRGWVLDTLPPDPPTGLLAGNVTEHAVTLTWSEPAGASKPPNSYVIERNGVKIGATTETVFTDSVLSENTSYDYTVYGKDDGIALSSPLRGTFQTLADIKPPLAVSAFSFGDSIDVTFSETVENVSAALKSNYSLGTSVTISGAALQGKNRVRLRTSSFSALSDSLGVSGIKDLAATPNMASSHKVPVTVVRNTWMLGKACKWDYLDSGKVILADDDYLFTYRPAKYTGLPYLSTNWVDRATSETTDFIKFDISRPMEVLVATFLQPALIPAWLKTWTNTGDYISRWNLYSKVFPAGTVTLAGNGAYGTNGNNYFVMLRDTTGAGTVAVNMALSHTSQFSLSFSPQPFTSGLDIVYETPAKCRIHLSICDVQGKIISILADRVQEKGRYRIHWDGVGASAQKLANGVYFCRYRINQGATIVRRMVLFR